jgi:hypothetical protein
VSGYAGVFSAGITQCSLVIVNRFLGRCELGDHLGQPGRGGPAGGDHHPAQLLGREAALERELGRATHGLRGEAQRHLRRQPAICSASSGRFDDGVDECRAAPGQAGDGVDLFVRDLGDEPDRGENLRRPLQVLPRLASPAGQRGRGLADCSRRVRHGAHESRSRFFLHARDPDCSQERDHQAPPDVAGDSFDDPDHNSGFTPIRITSAFSASSALSAAKSIAASERSIALTASFGSLTRISPAAH